MVWTIALRSRMNHRNSLRYSASLPKRGGTYFGARWTGISRTKIAGQALVGAPDTEPDAPRHRDTRDDPAGDHSGYNTNRSRLLFRRETW